jgi:hypothetical protein
MYTAKDVRSMADITIRAMIEIMNIAYFAADKYLGIIYRLIA